jgi:hypothetical protein
MMPNHLADQEKKFKGLVAGQRGRGFAEITPNPLLPKLKAFIARQQKALHEAVGSRKDNDHPELEAGTVACAKRLRRESETRFKKQFCRK